MGPMEPGGLRNMEYLNAGCPGKCPIPSDGAGIDQVPINPELIWKMKTEALS